MQPCQGLRGKIFSEIEKRAKNSSPSKRLSWYAAAEGLPNAARRHRVSGPLFVRVGLRSESEVHQYLIYIPDVCFSACHFSRMIRIIREIYLHGRATTRGTATFQCLFPGKVDSPHLLRGVCIPVVQSLGRATASVVQPLRRAAALGGSPTPPHTRSRDDQSSPTPRASPVSVLKIPLGSLSFLSS